MDRALWGSDVPVSAPIPPSSPPETLRVNFQGFGFEPSGLVFDLDIATWEEIYIPKYAPEAPR
jgi:hypothetical protein